MTPVSLTAAAAAGNVLGIATVIKEGHRLRLLAGGCASFVLEDLEQAQVRAAAGAVANFVVRQTIDHIIARRGAWSGDITASPNAFKFETILQFAPVTCTVVRTQEVARWVNKEEIALPTPPAGLKGKFAKAHQSAIQTAAYGLCMAEGA